MTVVLELKPDIETRLQVQAEVDGQTVEEYLRGIIEAALPPIPLEKAVALYQSQRVTQGEAAAMAGISRAEFIDALGRSGVSPFQYGNAEELISEITP